MELCQISGQLAFKSGHLPPSSVIRMTCAPDVKSRNRMFIAGIGFVGQALTLDLKKQGWDVSGTCTSITKKKKLEEEMGFDMYLFDANEPDVTTMDVMKLHTHMVVSIPPIPGIGDPMLQHEQLLRKALLGGNLQWLCYLSSTSVYGNCGGEWVDEDYPPNPTREVGKLRLAAEKGWLHLGQSLGISTKVFRLGGIYGPGRSAVDTIIKQEALSKSQRMRGYRQFTSRIHVEDICQAIEASICTASSREIYNIVDDDPAPREAVFEYARDLVDKKWPGWIKQASEQRESAVTVMKDGSMGEKRVCNARMKKELGLGLLHPSYRSGLQSIIDQMDKPFSTW
ncbi:putative NAD(P)-binding domain-containing protein [Rosa chinensis]|uniref:Putative NAD(P)-binding domain-containing protein n=1 Tax=Rosa chinensis TaxID=74649 RepID=A0A2P6PYW0_ROSCH|nr:protein YeeZ [Rosa chinensis]PRQ27096.1 putative NAD(P)-binding domain-containing protein [Rosa chinensis]